MNESENNKFAILINKLIGLKNKLVLLCKKIRKFPVKSFWRGFLRKLKKCQYKRIKTIFRKTSHWLFSSWKFVLLSISSFLCFYYIVGGILIEDIDVCTTRQLPKDPSNKLETAESLAFLINREIDQKMWTPNLPIIFPASFLDNMPNFQVGIIRAVRDTANVIYRLSINNEAQLQDAKEAYALLRYSPYIWLLSKKSTFNIAPSSNAQYRKARNALLQYNKNGIFAPRKVDFDRFLAQLSSSLRKRTTKGDTQINERSSDWFDNKDDDIFFINKGYAFASWQIVNALGIDYKDIILQNDIYTEWTYLVSALKKIAHFNPLIIKNGEIDSLFSPNHLIVQNYYFERAQTALENIRGALLRGENGY